METKLCDSCANSKNCFHVTLNSGNMTWKTPYYKDLPQEYIEEASESFQVPEKEGDCNGYIQFELSSVYI